MAIDLINADFQWWHRRSEFSCMNCNEDQVHHFLGIDNNRPVLAYAECQACGDFDENDEAALEVDSPDIGEHWHRAEPRMKPCFSPDADECRRLTEEG